jgi:uncharacterized membrane protein
MSTKIMFPQVLAEELDTIDGQTRQRAQPLLESDVYQEVHARADRLPALCLSGGGIRSATFSLGVMQVLAKEGLLHQFKYLSTVSGGGYIGSWLTAWIHRKAAEVPPVPLARVCTELAGENLPPGADGEVLGEAPAVLHLRRYSHYLAPKSGLFAADFWSLIATVLRNILLNWVVLIPVILAGLGLPRLFAIAARRSHDLDFAGIWFLIAIVLFAWVVAWVSRQRRLVGARRPGQETVLLLGVAPVVLGAIVFTATWAWWSLSTDTTVTTLVGSWWWAELVPFGILLMTLGWVGYQLAVRLFPKYVDPALRPRAFESLTELVVYVLSGAIGGIILRAGLHAFDGVALPKDDLWLMLYTIVAPPWFLLSFTLSAAIFVGLASREMSEEDREWWSRFGAWLLMASVLWTAIGVVTLLLPQLFADAYTFAVTAATTVGSGLVTVLGGLSRKTLWEPKREATEPKTRDEREESKWFSLAVKIALPLFVVLFAVFLSLATDFITGVFAIGGLTPRSFARGYLSPDVRLHLALARDPFNEWVILAGLIVGAIAAWFVGINTFSLHAMYRNRLIRAYLGASRGLHRHPDKFIGFDSDDDVRLCVTKPPAGSPRSLFHIVNMALNLVGGEELAWQERKAESMTATSLHVGCYRLGYRNADEYGGNPKTMTLGTAMAISGAAASPNMGYHSSPVLAFILTLFNARLGWWLGNPGDAGDKTYRYESPRWALRPLFAEALGQTDSKHPYVYASDGGHFENLGLYEVVRRRCGFIVVVDAGADPSCGFEDLSNAMRKIRSDFGISIDLDFPRYLYARRPAPADPAKGRFAITGRINYGDVDTDSKGQPVKPGQLIYIKPAFYDRDEPIDVSNYAGLSVTFPHETTADQFFSESQFESYRALGRYETERLCAKMSAPTFEEFRKSVADHLA